MALARDPDLPDWRNEAAYLPLMKAERAGFAWEWLRRQPEFRSAAFEAVARRGLGGPAEHNAALGWNLHAFEDPSRPVPYARPVWTALRHPWVIGAQARSSPDISGALDLATFGAFAKLVEDGGADRLLLSNGYRSIRLDVTGEKLTGPLVQLSYQLAGIRALDRPLLVLARLRSLAITGRFAPSLHAPVRRAGRLVLLLRTFDAAISGASQAEIAAVLFSKSFERERWRIHSPSLRSRAQRLVHMARRMSEGAFWGLLA